MQINSLVIIISRKCDLPPCLKLPVVAGSNVPSNATASIAV